jgi:hypothetical protein
LPYLDSTIGYPERDSNGSPLATSVQHTQKGLGKAFDLLLKSQSIAENYLRYRLYKHFQKKNLKTFNYAVFYSSPDLARSYGLNEIFNLGDVQAGDFAIKWDDDKKLWYWELGVDQDKSSNVERGLRTYYLPTPATFLSKTLLVSEEAKDLLRVRNDLKAAIADMNFSEMFNESEKEKEKEFKDDFASMF